MSNKSILAIILIIVAGVVYYFTKDKMDTASKDETNNTSIFYDTKSDFAHSYICYKFHIFSFINSK